MLIVSRASFPLRAVCLRPIQTQQVTLVVDGPLSKTVLALGVHRGLAAICGGARGLWLGPAQTLAGGNAELRVHRAPGPPLAPNDLERPSRDGLDSGLNRWPRPSRAQLRLRHSLSAILRQEELENTLAHAGDLRAAYFVLTMPRGA